MSTRPRLVAEPLQRPEDLAEPMPAEASWPRLRRRLVVLGALVVAVAAAVALLPGLGSIRDRFADARPGWLLAGALLQVGSCLSYVLAFRGVFCRRMSWRTSTEIGLSELAANSLVSAGGAGGLALGAWILRRGGMPAPHIAQRTVAFFLITSLANVAAVIVGGLGLATGVLNGAPSPWLGIVPAAAGLLAVGGALLARPIARALARRTERPRLQRGLEHLAAGVSEALRLLRTGDVAVIAGALGYMLFDVAMLGACFQAFGRDAPAAGVLLMAYLIGQLGGLIPIPGGIGGVDGGLIGTLVVYGVLVMDATVAVLAYRGLVLLIPAALGVPTLLVLQKRLRDEATDIAACVPGGQVEILGRGRVTNAPIPLEGGT
ncbi:MAG: flippase-like domain-containing protein [Actinomycetota bacterium]|nr:flippase-like domain-containing protein [Actinomycetota bacterium]